MAMRESCFDCPDCGHHMRRHRVEEKTDTSKTYEYRCLECGARFTGYEGIQLRRAFGDGDNHDKKIPLAPKLKSLMENTINNRFLTTQ